MGLQPRSQHLGRLRPDAPRRRRPRLGDGAKGLGAPAAPAALRRRAPVADTLSRAATLTGLDKDALRTDELANIRGGAALLAAEQRSLGLPVGASTLRERGMPRSPTPPGSAQEDVAAAFADDTFAVIVSGAARRTVDGKDVSLLPTPVTPRHGATRPTRAAEEGQPRRRSTARPASTASGSRLPTRSSAPTRPTTATTTSRAARRRRRSRASSSTTPRRATTRP